MVFKKENERMDYGIRSVKFLNTKDNNMYFEISYNNDKNNIEINIMRYK